MRGSATEGIDGSSARLHDVEPFLLGELAEGKSWTLGLSEGRLAKDRAGQQRRAMRHDHAAGASDERRELGWGVEGEGVNGGWGVG